MSYPYIKCTKFQLAAKCKEFSHLEFDEEQPSTQSFLTLFILLLPFTAASILAQENAFRQKVEQLLPSIEGKVGVAIMSLEDSDSLTLEAKARFPMQSVYKFPLALAVLHQVDKGKLSLKQKIYITKQDLLPNTLSPLGDKYPNGGVDISISDLLYYTVSLSDKNGCDILIRLLGGTQAVEKYIHSLGIRGIAITATEEQMHSAWQVQYTNLCEPIAMLALLHKFYKGELLTKSSRDSLWKIMVTTPSKPKRIKGLLPKDAIVAHKPGISSTNAQGITAATNDVGIVSLPNGKHFVIVVFVSDSPKDEQAREGVTTIISVFFTLFPSSYSFSLPALFAFYSFLDPFFPSFPFAVCILGEMPHKSPLWGVCIQNGG